MIAEKRQLFFSFLTAYENLKHLELAIRQLKEILEKRKGFNEKELTDYENQISNLITDLLQQREPVQSWTLQRSRQP